MNVAVIASCYGYGIDQVKPWVNSLKQTGFKGMVFVIVYNPSDNILLEYFKSEGIFAFVAQFTGETNMATQRFINYIEVLNTDYGKEVDLVISTDIRDIVFQTDPGVWLQNNMQDYDLVATSEGIRFRHEDWNGGNLEKHFGKKRFVTHADKETLCSGIIAGKKDVIMKLFKTIYEIAFFSEDTGDFVDQVFYNIAIYEIFKEKTRIVSAGEDWVANIGTIKAIPENMPKWSTSSRCETYGYERIRKNKTYNEVLLCKIPEMKDTIVYAENGKPYSIVHQYDRYQPWKEILLEKYGGFKFAKHEDLGFYLWAYKNVESADYILGKLRESYPKADLVISSDNGESFEEVAIKHSAKKYIHGTKSHGPSSKSLESGRYGWTVNEANLWLARLYEACKEIQNDWVMLMEEDILVKQQFTFPANDIIMIPKIHNPISNAGLDWIKSVGGNISYPWYSAGGGSIINKHKFIEAYEKNIDSFVENYERIYEESMKQGAAGWGWNDSIIAVLMYSVNATISVDLPIIESGNEEDNAAIIHKFKKHYRTT